MAWTKNPTDTHNLRVRLVTTRTDEHMIEKRYRMIWSIHNQAVKFAQRQINKLTRDREYIDARKAYGPVCAKIKRLKKSMRTESVKAALKDAKKEKKRLKKILKARTEFFSLTQAGLYASVNKMQKRFSGHLSSQQVQKEVDRVYKGVREVLYGDGEYLHLKRLTNQRTISQKCATNGIKVDLDSDVMTWNGLRIPIVINRNDPYVAESIDHDLKYAELVRLEFMNGYHYYLNLYFEGKPPKKLKAVKEGLVGVDPGVSTVACVSEDDVLLEELAPDAVDYDKEIQRQQRFADACLRAANPMNFAPDGTIKAGKHEWIFTKTYCFHMRKARVLSRKKSAATLCSHNHLCNRLLVEYGKDFRVEKMNYKALQKKAKKLERQDKASKVTKKDGTVIEVHKYGRRKRFGKSVNNRAPSLLLTRLTMKAELYGGSVTEIDTQAFRASQYHHDTGKYIKPALSERWKNISGHRVQRDLYSAFLIYCSNKKGSRPIRKDCKARFPKFVKQHDAFIAQTKGKPHPGCFGY